LTLVVKHDGQYPPADPRHLGMAVLRQSGSTVTSRLHGKLLPRTQDCYACHLEHGAVDSMFVQFYPALLEIAKQKGTLANGR
jgi:hypothetical protein